METKYVYSFNEGSRNMRALLGGKGANLAEMTKIGLPVPFGFTVTTEACRKYFDDHNVFAQEIIDEIREKMTDLENVTGHRFGDAEDPLLVSVRSGAPQNMPGMMDSILNLGLNDITVESLGRQTGDICFALDSYRRLIQMFGDVAQGVDKKKMDRILEARKAEIRNDRDPESREKALRALIREYKDFILAESGKSFPQAPGEQLLLAIAAVFQSWHNERAAVYRKLKGITDDPGTAVNVQAMVFGNRGERSCTGVAFSRNPSTGEKGIYGEFLVNAQGEDLVEGNRTPRPIYEMEENFPEAYHSFSHICSILEKHYKDLQDVEFTVEDGRLFILQTRRGRRTAQAAVKIAVDMVDEGLIDSKTAVLRIEPQHIEQLMHSRFDEEELSKVKSIAKGIPASPGAATGCIAFGSEDLHELKYAGKPVILVRQEPAAEDLSDMVLAEGVLTAKGGSTSHAAVVARGIGKCCITGCKSIWVDEKNGTVLIRGKIYRKGDIISISGSTGNVYEGSIKRVKPDLSGDFARIMTWADNFRTMQIRTNADTPEDVRRAASYGAEGIGLCRTEHMFFPEDRITTFQEMILVDTEEERRAALSRLLPFQESDFEEIFEAMEDRPVTIRLLDPPLHEFLPVTEEEFRILSRKSGIEVEKLKERADSLKELNPMLGKRGCRLAIEYPEIPEMQTEAIMTAAVKVSQKLGFAIRPEILIPLSGTKSELKYVKDIVTDKAEDVMNRLGMRLEYLVGTMIEVPRAALTADYIAETAQFFSFGTNDLTQMTFGFSRDDTAKLIQMYLDKGLLEHDPFKTIDVRGVGRLMEIASELGRKTRPTLKLGLCGEHGGDPRSIAFCQKIGMNYVSCSPFRVPIARLAAAQAAINSKQ